MQIVAAMAFCVGFLCAVSWLRPFASRTANLFKVGAEASLLVTLMLIVLLKIDLSKEDIPGGEDFIGGLLLLSNTVIPGGALVLAILSFGFDTGALDLLAEKAVEKLEEKEKKSKKKGKKQDMDFEDNPVADSE